MTPDRLSGRDAIFALVATILSYCALLMLLTLRVFSSYDDIIMALGLTALGVFFVREALNRPGAHRWLRDVVLNCRNLPLTTRILGAFTLLAMALVFDRYLDGDAEHYRLATFIVPVIVSVVLFDLRAAAFAIAASSLALDFFLIPPVNALAITTSSDALDLMIYIFGCGQLAIGIERLVRGDELAIAK